MFLILRFRSDDIRHFIMQEIFHLKWKKKKENNANKMANFNWISRIYLANISHNFKIQFFFFLAFCCLVFFLLLSLAFKSLQLTMIHFKFMQANFPKNSLITLKVKMIITKIVWFDNDEMFLLLLFVFSLLFKSTHYYWINKVWMEMFI